MQRLTLLLPFFCIVLFWPAESNCQKQKRGLAFFEAKIRPVLVNKCYSCHSAKAGKAKGGLLLDTREGIRKGGESGPAVVPKDAASSLLIEAIKHESNEMPPEEKLSDTIITDFVRWVEFGAPDPRNDKTVDIKEKIDFDEGRKFWAFQPLQDPIVPNSTSEWPRTEIDHFIASQWQSHDLKPVVDANATELLRRDYVNLTGLPPTPEQSKAFLNDQSPDRRQKLINELLNSEQFGERWGRHWLDVARFAESNGRERNFLFPHAWRYRDYVIQSFNEDKPFDRFIKEQIAGDLIDPLDGEDPLESKIATGFLAIGAKLLNEGNKEVFAFDLIDEQIDVTTRGFMGLTVSCARCHDHKFDPVSTQDYYAIAGIYRSTQTLFGRAGNGSRQASGLISLGGDEKASAQNAANKQQENIAGLQRRVRQVNAKQKELSQSIGRAKKNKSLDAKTRQQRLQKLQKELNTTKGQLRRLQKNLRNARKNVQPEPKNAAMGASEGKPVNCNVLIRGEVKGKGELVQRGFLTVLDKKNRRELKNTSESGRRELANWIASEKNPLTARVFVNRVWKHLFGVGLVRTVDNFGETGERPTHPQLLDYLAKRFIESGWSTKSLIREIMNSRTYTLSSQFDTASYETDPDNRYFWRMNMRRLEAEVIRDSMLLASGEIDLAPGEKSEIAKFKSSQGLGRGLNESQINSASNKRSVYLPIVRNAVPESLRVFDFAEPSIIVGDRKITTVPTQALYLMNSSFVIEKSRSTAKKILAETNGGAETTKLAYQQILHRVPSPAEIERSAKYIDNSIAKLSSANPRAKQDEIVVRAWASFCQALFANAEFRYIK